VAGSSEVTVESPPRCRVCDGAASWIGTRTSKFSGRTFTLARCESCGYAFVADPRTDFAALYDASYYSGGGADGNVDYERELTDDRTIRAYEWQGILDLVSSLIEVGPETRWLDFGCGLGGFVRYARRAGLNVWGYDVGYAASRMRDLGIPAWENLESAGSTFDVVTAVELIEHSIDPVGDLRRMASLLRDDGVLVLATGNSRPHRDHLTEWKYLEPIDVHVGVFEPRTLARALELAGLTPEWPGYHRGHRRIIRHKVLKALRVNRRNPLEQMVPWPLASRIVDRRHEVSRHPIGRKRPEATE
jgi:SAM-dependent methyltransferase